MWNLEWCGPASGAESGPGSWRRLVWGQPRLVNLATRGLSICGLRFLAALTVWLPHIPKISRPLTRENLHLITTLVADDAGKFKDPSHFGHSL